jgi:hypothetical protein
MDPSQSPRITRRRILGAAAGGAAAATAAALAAPAAALGNTGDTMHAGWDHTATTRTLVAATGAAAIIGESNDNDGLTGGSGGVIKSGVYGYTTNPGGYAVFGRNEGNHGIAALGAPEAALASGQGGAPLALKIGGKAQFSRSGVVTIAKNKRSVKLPATAITAASFAVATVQQYRTNLYVQCVVRNAAGTAFYAYLNRPATAATKIGWIVFEMPS